MPDRSFVNPLLPIAGLADAPSSNTLPSPMLQRPRCCRQCGHQKPEITSSPGTASDSESDTIVQRIPGTDRFRVLDRHATSPGPGRDDSPSTASDWEGFLLVERIKGTDNFRVIPHRATSRGQGKDDIPWQDHRKRKRDGSMADDGQALPSRLQGIPEEESSAKRQGKRRVSDTIPATQSGLSNPVPREDATYTAPGAKDDRLSLYNGARSPREEREATEESEVNKKAGWIQSSLPGLPHAIYIKMEELALRMAGSLMLCQWRSILQTWRQNGSPVQGMVSLSTSSLPSRLLLCLHPITADERLLTLKNRLQQSKEIRLLYHIFDRLSIIQIYDRYQELKTTTNCSCGLHRATMSMQLLYYEVYGERETAKSAKEKGLVKWEKLLRALARGKRWALFRDALGLGAIGLVLTKDGNSFVETHPDEHQYRTWLEYVRLFHRGALQFAAPLEAVLVLATSGQPIPPSPSRLELSEGDHLRLGLHGAGWLDAADGETE